MNDHTAPWFIVSDVPGHEIGYRAIVDADGCTVCDPSPMGEANAALIAAAPLLMRALATLLPYAENEAAALDDLKDSGEAEQDADRAWEAIEAARAALKAAAMREVSRA
jgi:hypothetical protein